MTEKNISFEQAIAKLEQIVGHLERGDVPLEEAISYFKEGMELSQLCDEKLQAAEEQMAVILSEDGELRPFHTGGEHA